MQKYILGERENIFVVRIEHNVTLRVFAVALADKFYNDGDGFPENLTKKSAEKILKRSLFYNGIQGQFEDGYFEASFEESERYQSVFDPAIDWIKSKYDWLNKAEL